MAPYLVLVVDTEEDWFEDTARPVTLANLALVPSVHEQCFRPYGVRPTYLVTYPVATDAPSVAGLRRLADAGECEIGTHVHNWTSPPFTADDVRERTYQTELPAAVERQKIEALTDIIERAFGRRPVTFRGGRWGANARTIRILEELGYSTDTSVVPVTDFSPYGGGPDFFGAPFRPYVPSRDDLLVPAGAEGGRAGALLELPVTAGFSRPDFERQRARLARILALARRRPVLRHLHLVGLLHRLDVLRRITLSPESATFRTMRQLVDAVLERGDDVLHVTIHSNVFDVGTSPLSRTTAERDRRLRHLREILDYAVNVRGAVPVTVAGYRAAFDAARARPGTP